MDPNTKLCVVSNDVKRETNHSSSVTKNFVQIQTSRNEVHQRIKTFCALKRKNINHQNIREYCGREPIEEDHPFWDHINSCARVDAVFNTYHWKRMRVTDTRTENNWIPYSKQNSSVKSAAKTSLPYEVKKTNTLGIEGVEERLHEMESILKLKSNPVIRNDIFARLNQVENRILFLEGLTPEYLFTNLEKEGRHLVHQDVTENSEEGNRELEALVDGRLLIKCSSDEMEKRMSAIFARTRKSKDVSNIREYCRLEPVEEDHPLWEKINTCARVDAEFVPRHKCKNMAEKGGTEKDFNERDIVNRTMQKIEDADESLQNADMFLLYKPDQSTRKKVFSQIKDLEERIWHLHSSPNFFKFLELKYNGEQGEMRTKGKSHSYDLTVSEMQQRIQQLTAQLCLKRF